MTLGDSVRSVFLYFFLGNVHLDKDSFHYYRYPDGESMRMQRDLIPARPKNHIRIIVVSDTHNRHDRLGAIPNCDLFVHCGDILMTGKRFSYNFQLKMVKSFDDWMLSIPAEKRIVVAGNHDDVLVKISREERKQIFNNAEYLENESILWKGAHIWASPISSGHSPNRAFQSADFEKTALSNLPSSSVDILITHGINPTISNAIQHKLHLFGHNHNSYGIKIDYHENVPPNRIAKKVSICAPICDGGYRLNQLPIIIDYPLEQETLESSGVLSELDSSIPNLNCTKPQKSEDNYVSSPSWLSWFNFKLNSKVAPSDPSKYQ
jgi:hypothetical protein